MDPSAERQLKFDSELLVLTKEINRSFIWDMKFTFPMSERSIQSRRDQ